MELKKNPAIFLSYAKPDKGIADQIKLFFKSNDLDCWLDESNISLTTDYLNAIHDAIMNARVMSVLFIANTNNFDFVKNEIRLALGNTSI